MNKEEYKAKAEWLRLNPHGMRAQSVRRELRAYERELEAQGVDIESLSERRTLMRGYVVRGGQVIHADRDCLHLSDTADEDVREATAEERAELPPCQTCAE
jgi:hypothetical protein